MNPDCIRASGKPYCVITNQHLALSENRAGTRTRYACYVAAAVGLSQDKGTLSWEEIKPVALSIVKLRLAEGIGQLVIQLVENSVK